MIPLMVATVGNIVYLFPNYDLTTPIVFELIGSNLTDLFLDFNFDNDANISSISEALALSTLTPSVISTQDEFTSLLSTVFSALSNETTSIAILSNEYSCAVYQYANDTNTTGYLVLQSIVQNGLFNRSVSPDLNISVDLCSCIDLSLEAYSSGLRCLATQTLLYGTGTFNDGGVAKEILVFFVLSFCTLVLAFLQIFLVRVATESWIHRIRQAYYQAILKQNIGWFDFNSPGALASRLEK